MSSSPIKASSPAKPQHATAAAAGEKSIFTEKEERVLKAAKKHNKEFKIIILAEQELPYSQLESVLITCAMAGVTEINFKTKQGNMAQAAGEIAN